MSGQGEAAGLTDAFRALLSSVAPEPPPLPGQAAPPALAVAAAPAPAPKPRLKDQMLADGVAVNLTASVVSKSGRPARLRLTLRRVYVKDGKVVLYGFAHDLRRNQAFLADDIMQVEDARGRVFTDAQEYVMRQVVFSDDQVMKRIVAALRPDLTVLAFVAGLSRRITDREWSVMFGYVREHFDGQFNTEALREYIASLDPGQESVMAALDEILARPPAKVQEFVRACVELATIDEELSPAELDFLRALKDYCAKCGVAISI
ncbi:hypothetical protein FACS1894186_8430 [Alphaproteobacteria bacterium]|nr:hypothetical protein FACS1894186_8430 [Alphaproteobacteria bacterium]